MQGQRQGGGMGVLVPPFLLRPIFVNRANPSIFFWDREGGRRGTLLSFPVFKTRQKFYEVTK